MNKINYEKLLDELLDVVPANWKKVVLYAEYTATSYSFKYFVNSEDKYIDCFDLKGIDETLLIQKFMKLDEIIRPSRAGLSGKNKWSVMTVVFQNDGNFKTEFDYDDISENSIEYFQKWKTKYLK